MGKRKFEFEDGNSHKFWHVERKSNEQTVWYGKIGTAGQTRSKSFESPALAKTSVENLIAQKLKKGYVEKAGQKKSSAKNKKAVRKKSSPIKGSVTNTLGKQKTGSGFSVANLKGFFQPLKKNELKGHPKLTTQLLKKIEKQTGIKFPAAMVTLLKLQNGGYLETPEFKFGRKTFEVEEIWPIRENGIEALVPEYSDHLEMASGTLKRPEAIFPFCGDGHVFFALDYRKSGFEKEPTVVSLILEGKVSCKQVATSFDSFLAGWQKPNPTKSVNFESVDPDTIIGSGARKGISKPERREQLYRDNSWLCINGDVLEHYEWVTLQFKRTNGKWNEEFAFERWTLTTIQLQDISSIQQSTEQGRCYIEINPNHVMRATKGEKPKRPANTVSEQVTERDGIGKPWKSKRKTKTFIFPDVLISKNDRASAIRKIKAAVKKC